MRHSSPVVTPPAKNTKPDGSDDAANLDRVWPKPAESLVQLLLLTLYISTPAENPSPNLHASSSAINFQPKSSSQFNFAF
jgi:hypothetical protein